MEYEKEVGKLTEGSTVWKPTTGVHDVLIMEEPEECEYTGDDGKVTPQIKLKVRVKDEELTWYITKGQTAQSVYGQLMYIGKRQGKLKGENLTLNVNETTKKDGKKQKSYSITEALRIIQEETIKTEEVPNAPGNGVNTPL